MNPPAPRPSARALLGLACALACTPPTVSAQDSGPSGAPAAVPVTAVPARTRLVYESVTLPGGEHMGLVGLTELLQFAPDFWAGAGVHGAASGHRGGLFVPGIEVAWSPTLKPWLALDAGLAIGGGGGHGAPVGGGLMLRPHLDLVYKGAGFYTGPTLSVVRFGGRSGFSSTQLGWEFSVASDLRVRLDGGHGRASPASFVVADGLGFDLARAVVTRYRPRVGSPDTDTGQRLPTIDLVGVRLERSADYGAWGIESAGAATSGVAGYAEVLGTGSLRWPLLDRRVVLEGRVAAGLAGGGGVDTNGGVLVKGAVGASWRPLPSLGLGLEVGQLHAPQGHFDARFASASLDWRLDPAPGELRENTRMAFAAGVERYDAPRTDGTVRPLEAGVLEVDRFVTPWLYLTGQAHSAFGGGAGAYSVGVFGAGVQWPVAPWVRLGGELLGGAAGGGGVDSHGALVQGRAYAELPLGRVTALRLGAGRVRYVRGGQDAPLVEAQLVFNFGIDRPH